MGLTLSDIIWPSPLFFLSFFIQISQGQCSPTYFEPSPFFLFFCLDFKIKFSPTYFGAFPYFLQFFFCLDVVDDLWHNLTTSLLFYHSLSIITRSIVSDIFWPFPLIFTFFVLLSKLNVLRHILTLSPHFYIFFSNYLF